MYGASSANLGRRECVDCPIGFISVVGVYEASSPYMGWGKISCILCEKGKYMDEIGNEKGECKDCEKGMFSDGVVTVAMKMKDMFAPMYGICKNCSVGKASSVGSSICNDCSLGTSSRFEGEVCTDCEPGYYRDEDVPSSTGICNACPTGYFQFNKKGTFCSACVAGQYNKVTASATCVACPSGFFQGKCFDASNSLLLINVLLTFLISTFFFPIFFKMLNGPNYIKIHAARAPKGILQ